MTTEYGSPIIIPVNGMSCSACVNHVEEALTGLPGVNKTEVNLATEKATVKIVETIVNITDLNKAVTQAGYRLSENEISHLGSANSNPYQLGILVKSLVSIIVAAFILGTSMVSRLQDFIPFVDQ